MKVGGPRVGVPMGPDGWGPGFHKMAPAKPKRALDVKFGLEPLPQFHEKE